MAHLLCAPEVPRHDRGKREGRARWSQIKEKGGKGTNKIGHQYVGVTGRGRSVRVSNEVVANP